MEVILTNIRGLNERGKLRKLSFDELVEFREYLQRSLIDKGYYISLASSVYNNPQHIRLIFTMPGDVLTSFSTVFPDIIILLDIIRKHPDVKCTVKVRIPDIGFKTAAYQRELRSTSLTEILLKRVELFRFIIDRLGIGVFYTKYYPTRTRDQKKFEQVYKKLLKIKGVDVYKVLNEIGWGAERLVKRG